MQAAKPRERSAFKAGDHAEDARLLAMLELGLKADHVPERFECIVLPELDHGMRRAAGSRVGQSDRLHRAEPQGFTAPFGHDFDGQASLEVRRETSHSLNDVFSAASKASMNASYCSWFIGQLM